MLVRYSQAFVGGFDLGLERAGMTVAWQAEIDPFANKVLAKHWPGVKRYGDVRNIGLGRTQHHVEGESDGAQACESDHALVAHVDLICGGFPCQDLSVAGKRAGLAGGRSGLWYEFHRILSDLRPTFCLIENVPGLLSSDSGRDFGIVLGGLGKLWPAVGWCVLDSQHFGVAQRRRRVYIIGGPSRACVQQILSLCESGDWHSQARRAEGQDIAATLRSSATGTYTLDGANGQSVRRLTPTECERLQGFPDGWTDVDGAKDGPRYKALGNAVTVPVAEYIGRQMLAVVRQAATL